MSFCEVFERYQHEEINWKYICDAQFAIMDYNGFTIVLMAEFLEKSHYKLHWLGGHIFIGGLKQGLTKQFRLVLPWISSMTHNHNWFVYSTSLGEFYWIHYLYLTEMHYNVSPFQKEGTYYNELFLYASFLWL